MGFWETVGAIVVMAVWFGLVRIDLWIKPDFWRSGWREVLSVVEDARPLTISSTVKLVSDLLFYLLGLGMILTPIVVTFWYLEKIFR